MGGMDMGGMMGAMAQTYGTTADLFMQAGAGATANRQNLWNMSAQNTANKANIIATLFGWGRDDNAMQRRVADLKAAGLSPVLAAGQAAGNMNPVTIKPVQGDQQLSNILSKAGTSISSDMNALVQTMQSAKLINSQVQVNDETRDKIKQQRELELGIYPSKLSNLDANTKRTAMEAQQKWLDYMKSKETSGTPKSELGRSVSDVAGIVNAIQAKMKTINDAAASKNPSSGSSGEW
ncbi:MAG: DNA pilot protein [Microvirus sp.]|nr:MAG: DNA pilot protein [Microvirus sp.]